MTPEPLKAAGLEHAQGSLGHSWRVASVLWQGLPGSVEQVPGSDGQACVPRVEEQDFGDQGQIQDLVKEWASLPFLATVCRMEAESLAGEPKSTSNQSAG